jgi:phosphatidylethanolamine-binding protein (PEBP) family uncharacterized protein
MGIRAATISAAALALVPALAGCGSSAPGTSPIAHPPKVEFKSAALKSYVIPANYTCDGKDVNLPLEWGPVPHDTGELVLAMVGLTPISPGASSYNATVEWAIAGIKPSLHKLAPGALPRGAHVGISRDGTRRFNICPKKGTTARYQFMLYGVPASVSVSRNFADEPVLATLTKPGLVTTTTAEGAFVAIYTRK